jgi:hypothetical protein
MDVESLYTVTVYRFKETQQKKENDNHNVDGVVILAVDAASARRALMLTVC